MKAAFVHTMAQEKNYQWVRYWLYFVFVLLLAIVVIGGLTRMTGSGLSITQWQPVHGVIPPLNQSQWQEEFQRYQQIAQYRALNVGMTLQQFKGLFWWEWFHRLLARFIGLIVALPLIYFWLTGRLNKSLKWRMVGLLALGALQGAIGWWMVSSGLGDSSLTSVSQYRLATHLTMAAIIMTAVLALARKLVFYPYPAAPRRLQLFSGLLVILVLGQIFMGAIVAGLHAGLIENTWPLMNGKIIPDGLFPLSSLWHSAFEDPRTAQFLHRSLAYLIFLLVLIHAFYVDRVLPQTTHARRALFLVGVVLIQALLGIVTLVTVVPLHWAILHQFFAFILLSCTIVHWQAMRVGR